MTDLVERLKRIADADYKEPDPRTGNYYEKDGETIMEAAAEIERLREHDSYECSELEHQSIALRALIALLEKQNETLRAVLKGVVQADPCSLEALYAINAAKAALNGGTK